MAESYDIHLTDPLSPAFRVRAFTTNGTIFPTTGTVLPSTSVGADTSLLVYGKGAPNYGERIAENIIHVMENFSGSTAPANAVSGQLWYARYTVIQTSAGWFLWDDGTDDWIAISPTISASAPAIVDGGYWYDNINDVIYYGIDDGSHPLSPTWLPRVHENKLSLGDPVGDPTILPRKVLKSYTGLDWVNVNAIASGTVGPTDAAEGDLWYDTALGVLKVYTGSSFVSVTGAYLPLAGGTMSGNIDMDSNSIVNLLDPANLQDAATKNYVDNEIATAIGSVVLPTQLSDLTDVASPLTPSAGQFFKYTGAEWDSANIQITDIAGITASVAEINYLVGTTSAIQGQLNGKLNLSGGTLTNFLTLHADPTANLHAATKQYVDNEIAGVGGGGADGVLSTATFTPTVGGGPMSLDLTTTAPSVFNIDMAHDHFSFDTFHTTTQPLLRDLLISYPNVQLSEVIETVIGDLNTRLQYYETFATREIFTATAAQVNFQFTDGAYKVGANRLQVYVDGVKAYADERAQQGIFMNTTKNLSASSPHGLADGTYDLDIAVDGTGAQTMSITVTNGTSTNTTIQDIIDEINADITTPGVEAVWSKKDTAIYVFSDTTGNGSEVNITDGTTNGILAALVAVAPTTELPILNAVSDVFPAYPGPVSQITANRAYKEVDAAFAETNFGAEEYSITFATPMTGGEVVEMISEPSFFNM